MDTTRLLAAVGATLVFNMAFSFLVHNLLLGRYYQQYAGGFLRSEQEVKRKGVWLMSGWALFTATFCVILIALRPQLDVMDGVVYGLGMGVLMIAVHLSLYATLPMPRRMAVLWTVTDIFASTGAGAVAAAVYSAEGPR